jgi:hypothetical protein
MSTDHTAAILPGTRLAIIVDSLQGLGELSPQQLVRCDPLSFDVLARELGDQNIVLTGDTTLRFGGAGA